MKKLTILAAAAPLALLAACGSNDAADDSTDADTATMDAGDTTSADTASTDSDAAEPMPATSLDDAGDFSGTYNFTRADGTKTGIDLDAEAGTYSYTGADGEKRSGNYVKQTDGYRFRIEDYNGSIATFAFVDGRIVRLGDGVDDDVTEATLITGDRYERDGGPVQGRDPEIGSQIPTD